MDFDGFPHSHVRPVTFIELRLELHLVGLKNLGDVASGIHLIALAIIGQSHAAEEEPARRLLILAHFHHPANRGAHAHAFNVPLRFIHG